MLGILTQLAGWVVAIGGIFGNSSRELTSSLFSAIPSGILVFYSFYSFSQICLPKERRWIRLGFASTAYFLSGVLLFAVVFAGNPVGTIFIAFLFTILFWPQIIAFLLFMPAVP